MLFRSRLNKDNKTEKIIQAIPKIENCLKTYHTLSIEDKNKLLKSIIKKAYYLKTATGGRWNKEAQDNFSIELELNL